MEKKNKVEIIEVRGCEFHYEPIFTPRMKEVKPKVFVTLDTNTTTLKYTFDLLGSEFYAFNLMTCNYFNLLTKYEKLKKKCHTKK